MNKKLKAIVISLLVILAILITYNYMFKSVKVDVFEIKERTNLKEEIKESGIVSSKNIYLITPAFDGKVYLKVKLGDVVKKGQILANLDTEDISNAIIQLDAQLNSIKAQNQVTGATNPKSKEIDIQTIKLENLKRNLQKINDDYNRTKTLYESGAASQVDLENAKNILDSAKNEIKIEENILDTMQANSVSMNAYYQAQLQNLIAQRDLLLSKKGRTNIIAPTSGIITKLDVKEGQKVSSMVGIMELSEIQNKSVESQIASEVAADLKVGDRVEIIYETKHNRKVFNGRINNISPYASTELSSLGIKEQKTKIETNFMGIETIPLGYKLDVNFITLNKPNVIVIPKLSTFKENEEYFVFKIIENKIVKQKIVKGTQTSSSFEIIEGLNEGDIIILDPNNKNIKEHTRVTY